MSATVDLKSAFGTDNPAEVVTRLETLKKSLDAAPSTKTGWSPALPGFEAPPATPVDTLADVVKGLESLEGTLTKGVGGVSADTISSLKATLAAQQADIVKDLTLTSPLSTGYVAFDLEQGAKVLAPRPTPLRNMIPRQKGTGTARRFKRITGFTGSGTGGVGVIRPGITDSSTATFGSLTMNRGPKISYAGDEAAVPYLQFGLSDSVPWSAQYAGQGFEDIRQLSQTSLLYSSMLIEERLLLGGRGTASGFAGALATPGTPTLTVRVAGAGEQGNTANIANLFVYVTAATVFGETVSGTATSTGLSAVTGRVVDVQLAAAVPGAVGYKVYAGSVNAAASVFPATLTISSGTAARTPNPDNQASTLAIASGQDGAVTINFNGGGTGGLPNSGSNPPTVANDSSALDYDGILTIALGAQSGYRRNLGTTFSSNPADEYNVAFASMYDSVKADPDLILLNGGDRKQLSDTIKLNANSSGYRIALTSDQAQQATVGTLVSGVQNAVTGKMVDLMVHPWLPQGVSPILSLTLPIPDTEVSNVWSVVNVQDYMAVQWPVLQHSYDVSSYWFGTFLCYAPAWNGCLSGIVRK